MSDEWTENLEVGAAMLKAARASLEASGEDGGVAAILDAVDSAKEARDAMDLAPRTYPPDPMDVVATALWARFVYYDDDDFLHPVCKGANPIREFAQAAIALEHLMNASMMLDEGSMLAATHSEEARAMLPKRTEEH